MHSQTYDNIYNFPLSQYQHALDDMEVLSDSEAAPAAPDLAEPEEAQSLRDVEEFVEAYSDDESDGDAGSDEADEDDSEEEAGPAPSDEDEDDSESDQPPARSDKDTLRRLAAAAAAAAGASSGKKRGADSRPAPKRNAKPARGGRGKRPHMEIEYELEHATQRQH